jgi:cytochrome c556
MKRLLLIALAVGLFGATPVMAEHKDMKMEHEGVRQCALQAESIQEKIKRLEGEVAKGEKKYDAKTLKKLKAKLDEANKLLDQLNKN